MTSSLKTDSGDNINHVLMLYLNLQIVYNFQSIYIIYKRIKLIYNF